MDGEITPAEVAALLEDGTDVRVVDIRDERSFERGHIPDSENVPFRDLPGRVEAFEDATRVVTVCPHGKASVQAARLIGTYEGSADATVESMAGGLEAWTEEFELERGTDADDETDDRADAPF